MLRARTRATTASTGVNLSVSHGLGTVPDLWSIAPMSARDLGRTIVVAGAVGANRICINNPRQTTVTVDVFTWVWQGRLY